MLKLIISVIIFAILGWTLISFRPNIDLSVGNNGATEIKIPYDCHKVTSASFSYGNIMSLTCENDIGDAFTIIYKGWDIPSNGRIIWRK